MTNPTDPITLTREIVGQLVLFLEDFGQTSAANDAGLSTSNLVRNLRALLAEPKPPADKCGVCGGTGKAAGYHDVDHYYRDADGAADALTRHGIRDDRIRELESEITKLREAVSVLGRRVYMSAQSAHTVLGKVGETWEHFIPEDVLANPIASAAVRKAKEQA